MRKYEKFPTGQKVSLNKREREREREENVSKREQESHSSLEQNQQVA